ncbi:MAG: tRNA ligase subunit PheS family protein [Planctomycetota bacterium]
MRQELSGFDPKVKWASKWIGIVGWRLLKAATLGQAGHDADAAGGFSFGIGLDQTAVLIFGIDDIRKLWQPPYLTRK